jgi:hypothetical protein
LFLISIVARTSVFARIRPTTITNYDQSANMIKFPERTRQQEADAELEALPSRPNSSPWSISSLSYYGPESASSSTYFLNGNTSTQGLPEAPRPTHNRNSSASSAESSILGTTACATPDSRFKKGQTQTSVKEVRASVGTFDKRYDPKSYAVETLDKYDDVEFMPL